MLVRAIRPRVWSCHRMCSSKHMRRLSQCFDRLKFGRMKHIDLAIVGVDVGEEGEVVREGFYLQRNCSGGENLKNTMTGNHAQVFT